jgi:hypothetical protein
MDEAQKAGMYRKKFVKDYVDKQSNRLFDKLNPSKIQGEIIRLNSDGLPGMDAVSQKMYGSEGQQMRASTENNIIVHTAMTILRLDMTPDRFLEMLDGFTDGEFKSLFYDSYRGGHTTVGWEEKYLKMTQDIQKSLADKITELGIKYKSIHDKIYIDMTTKKVLTSEEAKKVTKKSIKDGLYNSYTRQEVMEMYASLYSKTKFESVLFGNDIPAEVMKAYIDAMPKEDVVLANHIMDGYSKIYQELRDAYELHTGMKMGYSDGEYSPIIRILDEWNADVEMGESMGENVGFASGNAQKRSKFDPVNQIKTRLGFISNYMDTIDKSALMIHGSRPMDIVRRSMGFGNISNQSPVQRYVAEELMTSIGVDNYRYLHDLYKALVTNGRSELVKDGPAEKVLLWATAGLVVDALGGKIINAALQSLGYITALSNFRNPAMALIKSPYFMLKYLADMSAFKVVKDSTLKLGFRLEFPQEKLNAAYATSPFLRMRTLDSFKRELNDGYQTGLVHEINKIRRVFMAPVLFMDELTSAAVWEARLQEESEYQSKLLKGKEKLSPEEEFRIAIIARNKATEIISKTQPNSDIMSTSMLMRKRGVIRLYNSFMQGISKLGNQLVFDSTKAFKGMLSKQASKESRIRSALFLSVNVMAILGSSVLWMMGKNARPPEDDKDLNQILMDILSTLGIVGVGMSSAKYVYDAMNGNTYFSQNRAMPLLTSWTVDAAKLITKASNSGDVADFSLAILKVTAPVPLLPTGMVKSLIVANEKAQSGDTFGAILNAMSIKAK